MKHAESPAWLAPAVYIWTVCVIAAYMIQFRDIIGPAFKSFARALF